MIMQKKIKEVHLYNFRTFKDQAFNIDEKTNLIVLFGNNGLGKTAFFDGIEWGLTGSLKRYDVASREKNEYPVLGNIFRKDNEPSYVNIVFNDNSQIVRHVLKRGEGDFNSGIIKNGFDINNVLVHEYYKGIANFSTNFAFSQFLSQELINSFIRSDKDTDRYNAVVNLFGLSRYAQYQDLTREVLVNIKQRINVVNMELFRLKENINKEKSNYNNIDIDNNLKCQELNNLIKNKINFNDEANLLKALEITKSEGFKIKKEYEDKINKYKHYLVDTKELDDSFNQKEDEIKQLDNYRKSSELIKKYIDLLDKYKKCVYIIENFEKYIKYKEEETRIVELEKKYMENLKIYKALQNASGSIDKEISVLDEVNKSKELSQQYYDLSANLRKNKEEMQREERILKEKSSIKQQFLSITANYLRENISFKKCPVCENNFDINNTIKRLSEEINKESDEQFIDTKLRINVLNEAIAGESIKLQQIIQIISIKVKDLTLEYDKKLANEKAIIDSNEIIKLEYGKVKNYLEDLNIDINDAKTYCGVLKNEIDGLKIEEDIEYYRVKFDDIINKISTTSKSISIYINLKQKYKIEKKEDITTLIKKCNEVIEEYNGLVLTQDKIIKLSEELNQYYINYFSKTRLMKLNQTLKQFQKEYDALVFIEQEFTRLDQNARVVIEKQTKKTLDSYEETIKRIYKYLNPNLIFDDFNFKIDDSNAKNNRMILEVTGLNGYKMNPAYSFSSAQNNVLAISIFLSFALTQRWSNLGSIFMDDPIQNMDDININNFVDILRNIIKKTNKQIFISTHDERIYNFIRNKFSMCVQTFEFKDYGKIRTELLK